MANTAQITLRLFATFFRNFCDRPDFKAIGKGKSP
jgi:hypothetical protein